ncbi:hypothetical protein [Kordiimonas sp.]|uniref:hypothetical protein n=1 Tax=Kordiimonas sp. TaxID=1970157 RepID=UPI003A8FA54D
MKLSTEWLVIGGVGFFIGTGWGIFVAERAISFSKEDWEIAATLATLAMVFISFYSIFITPKKGAYNIFGALVVELAITRKLIEEIRSIPRENHLPTLRKLTCDSYDLALPHLGLLGNDAVEFIDCYKQIQRTQQNWEQIYAAIIAASDQLGAKYKESEAKEHYDEQLGQVLDRGLKIANASALTCIKILNRNGAFTRKR